jgi:hypothetical protein
LSRQVVVTAITRQTHLGNEGFLTNGFDGKSGSIVDHLDDFRGEVMDERIPGLLLALLCVPIGAAYGAVLRQDIPALYQIVAEN